MAKVQFQRGTEANIIAEGFKTDGLLSFAVDSGRIYIDVNNERVLMLGNKTLKIGDIEYNGIEDKSITVYKG